MNIFSITCADPESFVRGGPTQLCHFDSKVVDGGIKIPLKVGHHWPAS